MSANPTRHPPLDELSAWVDGEISGEPERRLLAEHVADCPSCASLAEDFRALARAQAQAGVPPVPAHLEQRVVDALASETRFRSGPRRFVLPLSAAATVLVGVVALWLLRHQPVSEMPIALDQLERRNEASSQPAPTVEENTPTAVEPPAAAVPAAPPPPQATNEGERHRDASKSRKEAKQETFARAQQAPPPAPVEEAGDVPVQGGVAAKDVATTEADAAARAQEERAGAAAALGAVAPEQHRVAMKAAGWRWTRLAAAPPARDERQDAYAPAPDSETSAPAAEPSQPCPVVDRLEPSLRLQGLDAAWAGDLTKRWIAAGATTAELEAALVTRVTLQVAAPAWPQVRGALAEAGISVSDLPAVPEGAVCLVVTVEARP